MERVGFDKHPILALYLTFKRLFFLGATGEFKAAFLRLNCHFLQFKVTPPVFLLGSGCNRVHIGLVGKIALRIQLRHFFGDLAFEFIEFGDVLDR